MPEQEEDNIFSYTVNSSNLDKASITHIFNLAKMRLAFVKKEVVACQQSSSVLSLSGDSKVAFTFLDQLFAFVKSLDLMCAKMTQALHTHFQREVILLLKVAGRISSISELFPNVAHDPESIQGKYCNLVVSIWLSCARVLLTLISSPATTTDVVLCSSKKLEALPISHQIVSLILADLIVLSLKRLYGLPSNVFGVDLDGLTLSPVFSLSVREIRRMLRKGKVSFWNLVTSITSAFDSWNEESCQTISSFSLFPHTMTPPSDTLLATLWVLYYLEKESSPDDNHSETNSNNYQYASGTDNRRHEDANDNENELLTDDLNTSLVVDLIRKIVARDQSFVTESSSSHSSSSPSALSTLVLTAKIGRSFHSCGLLSSVDITFPFLDFFVKNLNLLREPVPTFTSSSTLTVPKSGREWSVCILQHEKPQTTTTSNTPTGNDIFPVIYGLFESFVKSTQVNSTRRKAFLKTTGKASGGDVLSIEKSTQLSRFKGRLYSKIQPKRLEEINEIGLYKFLSVFLSIPSWIPDHWTEMTDKVCEITQKIFDGRVENLRNGKTAVAMKALFTLLYLMQSSSSSSSTIMMPPSSASANLGESGGASSSSLNCSSQSPAETSVVASSSPTPLESSMNKVKQLVIRQIPLLNSPSSSTLESGRHPLALSFLYCGRVNEFLLEIVLDVARNYYLARHSTARPKEISESLTFLTQLHGQSKRMENEGVHTMIVTGIRDLLDLLIQKLVYSNDSALKTAIESVVRIIVSDIKTDCNLSLRQTIFGVVESFAKAHLEEAPTSLIPKVFSSMEVLIRACPELTKGTDTIFGLMNGIISDIEKRRRSGTEFEMRRNLNDILRRFSK